MILTVDDPDAVEFTILTSRCGLVVLIKETAKTISRRTAVAAAVATRAADSSFLARGARTTWRCSASTPVEVQRVTRRQQAIRPLRNPA